MLWHPGIWHCRTNAAAKKPEIQKKVFLWCLFWVSLCSLIVFGFECNSGKFTSCRNCSIVQQSQPPPLRHGCGLREVYSEMPNYLQTLRISQKVQDSSIVSLLLYGNRFILYTLYSFHWISRKNVDDGFVGSLIYLLRFVNCCMRKEIVDPLQQFRRFVLLDRRKFAACAAERCAAVLLFGLFRKI
jgi:hypothetical protein